MRPKTTEELQRAIVLREAGYTLAAITERTGISASTLQRAFRKHAVGRGALSTVAVEQARQQLLNDADFVGGLKHSVASAVTDDLAIVRQIRETLVLSLEALASDDVTPAPIKARALAAIATAAKLSQDIQRRSLRMDYPESRQADELTTLVVYKMTDEEVREAQNRLRDDYDEQESVNDDLLLIED
jgi:AraC-like DNA-binding protein